MLIIFYHIIKIRRWCAAETSYQALETRLARYAFSSN